jgi:hypothetical protein
MFKVREVETGSRAVLAHREDAVHIEGKCDPREAGVGLTFYLAARKVPVLSAHAVVISPALLRHRRLTQIYEALQLAFDALADSAFICTPLQ